MIRDGMPHRDRFLLNRAQLDSGKIPDGFKLDRLNRDQHWVLAGLRTDGSALRLDFWPSSSLLHVASKRYGLLEWKEVLVLVGTLAETKDPKKERAKERRARLHGLAGTVIGPLFGALKTPGMKHQDWTDIEIRVSTALQVLVDAIIEDTK